MHATTSRTLASALLSGAVMLVCTTAQAQSSGSAGSGQPNMSGAPYGVTTPGSARSGSTSNTTSGTTSGTSSDSMSGSTSGTTTNSTTTNSTSGSNVGGSVGGASGMSGTGTTSGTGATQGAGTTSGASGGTYDQSGTLGTPSSGAPAGMSGTLQDSGSGARTDSSASGVYDSTSSTPMAFDPPAAGYSGRNSSYSWLPYTTRGYVGLHWGQADFDDVPCSSAYSCDDTSDKAFKVYTGGMFNDYFGLELGYLNTGSVDRSGGRTRAHGANLSLIAQAPLGQVAGIYAKAGVTYGWTRTSTGGLAVDVDDGKDSGAGPSYGAGLRFNATPNWALVLEWERHEMRFAGDDKRDVSLTTLGVQYRF